jgi:hypothetical protein
MFQFLHVGFLFFFFSLSLSLLGCLLIRCYCCCCRYCFCYICHSMQHYPRVVIFCAPTYTFSIRKCLLGRYYHRFNPFIQKKTISNETIILFLLLSGSCCSKVDYLIFLITLFEPALKFSCFEYTFLCTRLWVLIIMSFLTLSSVFYSSAKFSSVILDG